MRVEYPKRLASAGRLNQKNLQQWKVQSSTSQGSYSVYSSLHSLLSANVGRETILCKVN